MSKPPPGLPARFPTVCPRCDEPIHVGDRIGFARGLPTHCACIAGADDE